MSEFYIKIARKKIFLNFMGHVPSLCPPPSPTQLGKAIKSGVTGIVGRE